MASLQPGNRPLAGGRRGRGLRPLGQVHSTAPAVQQLPAAPLRFAWERVGGANDKKIKFNYFVLFFFIYYLTIILLTL